MEISDTSRQRNSSALRPVASIVLSAFMLATLIGVAIPPANQKPKIGPNPRIAPAIPRVKRIPELVFLEKANSLSRAEGQDYMVVTGDVEFSKGGMRMYTDSAHYYDTDGSFNAFGNVRMVQGDTLFVYADELNYDGMTEMAYLFGFNGKPVRLINRDVKLETDVFTYDMPNNLGYYNTGGVLTDKQNRLESQEGEYSPDTKEANFYTNVILTSKRPNDELRMVGEALYYNTATHIAEFNEPTVITNKDGRIDSNEGIYNTETRIAELFAHSIVTTSRGSTLEGDTLFYDRKAGWGEAYGNMALVDTAKCAVLYGDYGFYNEITDSAFVTGHALGKEYSRGDTLFIHGRYLTMVRNIVPVKQNDDLQKETDSTDSLSTIATQPEEEVMDTTHTIRAWPRVRFFRSDMQGLCDSLVFTQTDTIVRLFHHPIVWSEERQIFGNLIEVHLNDSTVDYARLPDFGFMAQQIEGDFFNQLSGKNMEAWFTDGNIDRTLITGSVEGIVFPEENDSTINKLVNFQTANLEGWFKDENLDRLKMWPQTDGEAIPLYLAKYADLHLPKFNWYTGLRPESPMDVLIIPAEMETLMSDRPIKEIKWRKEDEAQPESTETDEPEDNN